MKNLLTARLTVDYPNKPGVLRDVEFEIAEGEILGLVGESGSGKSTIALALLRLLDHKGGKVHGEIQFDGRDLVQLPEKEMRRIRGREIALVLQSPLASLNPVLKIGTQVAEAWRAHNPADAKRWKEEALGLFSLVNLPAEPSFLDRYPRQLSVGQAQRVLIAMSILHKPRLLITDEATSAVDAITQSEILELFRRLNRQLNMAMLFISHDLLSVASLCSRIAILQRGQIIECGATDQMFRDPRTEDTRALLQAVMRNPFVAQTPELVSRE
ncbi:MAG TPA: ABC transporter ATP-binding protein [Bryobacteraceae bacterium]|jgi:ABC-type glutathione transport system ATPase component|nr:ABC transporter ATP-binding protein [Bryobacteraceae bacterium]